MVLIGPEGQRKKKKKKHFLENHVPNTFVHTLKCISVVKSSTET